LHEPRVIDEVQYWSVLRFRDAVRLWTIPGACRDQVKVFLMFRACRLSKHPYAVRRYAIALKFAAQVVRGDGRHGFQL